MHLFGSPEALIECSGWRKLQLGNDDFVNNNILAVGEDAVIRPCLGIHDHAL